MDSDPKQHAEPKDYDPAADAPTVDVPYPCACACQCGPAYVPPRLLAQSVFVCAQGAAFSAIVLSLGLAGWLLFR